MSKRQNIVKTATLLIVFSIVSKLLGLLRDSFIAASFGAGSTSDVFFLSITIITLITALLTQAINSVTIPALVRTEQELGTDGKNRFVNNILHLMIIISSGVTALCYVFTPQIVSVVALGFNSEQTSLMITLMRIGFPTIILATISGVNIAYLQSESRYVETALNGFVLNVTYIVFIVFAAETFGVYVLPVAVLLGGIIQIIIQRVGLAKTNFKWLPVLNFRNDRVKQVVKLTIPIIISVGISNVNKLIDKMMASTLPSGAISALSYAGKINTMVLGIFIVSITTAMFPTFSKYANEKLHEKFKNTIKTGLNSMLILTVPTAAALMVMGKLGIQVIFERGAFTAEATQLTTESLFFYSFGLIGMSIRLLMIKIFYSLQDTKTPVINGVICMLVNIGLNFLLLPYLAHKGLALATSVASTLLATLLLISLYRKIGDYHMREILVMVLKVILSSIIMAGVIYVFYHFVFISLCDVFFGRLLVLLILIAVGLAVYFGCMILFKVSEVKTIFKTVLKKQNNFKERD